MREILEDRAISQADFAVRLGRSEKFVSQLVNGKAPLSFETAIDLERTLGVPASFWNAAEATYRDLLARARDAAESDELTHWAKTFPLKEMAEQGWIARETSPGEQARGVLEFFGVASIEAYHEYWGSEKRLAARMSTAYTPETRAITAWLRAGEREAEAIKTEPYDDRRLRDALLALRATTRLTPDKWIPRMQELCAGAGVAVVFVHDLPGTRCHAVSWWASKSRAVIQLGLRGRTDDQVWFSFYHEAGHILLDERGRSRITDLNGMGPAEDRANAFAGDFLIPPELYAAFVSRGRPGKADVSTFARQIGIAASIVVGRLQRDGVIPYNWLNDMKTKLAWG